MLKGKIWIDEKLCEKRVWEAHGWRLKVTNKGHLILNRDGQFEDYIGSLDSGGYDLELFCEFLARLFDYGVGLGAEAERDEK